MWFTIAIEPDSKLGLQGTLDVLAGADRRRVDPPAADAEAVQDPHGPRDGEGHRGAGRRGEAVEPLRARARSSSPTSDVATIRATQGDMPVVAEPYAPAAERLGIGQAERARAPRVAARARRPAPRRRDPLPPPRRLLRQRHGRLEGARGRRSSSSAARMAAFRGISHCYQRPTYADWPYSVFTMAHGRSKEECDAILDSIAERDRHRRARDALLVDRVQEGPAALLHRRRSSDWEARARRAPEPPRSTDARSAELYRARASHVLPGRRQLAGARDALDRPRPDLHRARPRARSSSTSTATATSTTSARGAR